MIVCDSVPGPKTSAYAKSLEGSNIIPGDDASKEHGKVGESSLLQFFHDARDQCHVRSRQDRQPDNVDIFLQRGLGHHCRRRRNPV